MLPGNGVPSAKEWRMRLFFLRLFIPRRVWAARKAHRTLSRAFGHDRSIRQLECVDRKGKPLPWFTYPAIEYLRQLDLSNKTVLEFGSGNSTKFWAENCREVVSIEDNPQWYEKLKAELPANVEYIFATGPEEYVAAGVRSGRRFDVVAIDGNYRLECACAAAHLVAEDGFIVLDNADWYERSAEALRASDLITVNMAGFGPMLPHTWTTSFYFSRRVQLKPRGVRFPDYGIGARKRTEAQQRGEIAHGTGM